MNNRVSKYAAWLKAAMGLLLLLFTCGVVGAQADTETPSPTATLTPTVTPTPTATRPAAVELTVADEEGGGLNYGWGDTFLLNYIVHPGDNDFTDISGEPVDIYLYLFFPDGSYRPFNKSLKLVANPDYSSPTYPAIIFSATSCGRLKFKVGVPPLTGEYRFALIVATRSLRSGTYRSNTLILNKFEGPTPSPTPTSTPVPSGGLNLNFMKRIVALGGVAELRYTIIPPTDVKAVDIYLSVVTLDGSRYFCDKSLQFNARVSPVVKRWRAKQASGEVPCAIPGSIPEGWYWFEAVMVRTGANPFKVSNWLAPGMVAAGVYLGKEQEQHVDPFVATGVFTGGAAVPCAE